MAVITKCPVCGDNYERRSSSQKMCSKKCRAIIMRRDLTGKRYGNLVAEMSTDERDKTHCVLWRCRCDCGRRRFVASRCLIRGDTKRCSRDCTAWRSPQKHPDEFIASARELWNLGDTMSAIGRRLGVTKNVIAGLSHRHDFPPRAVARP